MITWLDKFSDRPQNARDRINDYLLDCNYAAPIKRFQPINKISLEKSRKDNPRFIVPRMYYYLDNHPLLEYLEKEIVFDSEEIVPSFDVINDDGICQ